MEGRCQRAFIIGVDGLRGPAVAEAETPNIDAVIAEGAATLRARTVMPSSSYPAWGSMFHGVGPDKHRLNNENPAADDAAWPSFLKLARDAHPDWTLGAFSSWEPINTDIIEDGAGCVCQTGTDAELAEAAAEFIRTRRPEVLFLQFDNVDAAGHKFGYRSEKYLTYVTKADGLAGVVLDAIGEAGVLDESFVLVVSDHGGVEFAVEDGTAHSHGSEHPDCMEVLWACRGPGVARGCELDGAVSITDTAAVVAHALGLTAPPAWESRVPEGVFV